MSQTPDSWNRPDEPDDHSETIPDAGPENRPPMQAGPQDPSEDETTVTWAPQPLPTSVLDAEPSPAPEPAYATVGVPFAAVATGAPDTRASYGDYGRSDATADDRMTGEELSPQTPLRRGIRIRTVVLGLVLFAIAGSVLISQLTSISVDPFAIALALMIGAGLLLLIAGSRRPDRT